MGFSKTPLGRGRPRGQGDKQQGAPLHLVLSDTDPASSQRRPTWLGLEFSLGRTDCHSLLFSTPQTHARYFNGHNGVFLPGWPGLLARISRLTCHHTWPHCPQLSPRYLRACGLTATRDCTFPGIGVPVGPRLPAAGPRTQSSLSLVSPLPGNASAIAPPKRHA